MKIWSKTLPFLLILMASGCAIYKGGNVPETTLKPLQKETSQLPTVSYTSLVKSGLSTPKEQNGAIKSLIEGEFTSTLKESKYFSRISSIDDNADIKIDFSLTNSGNPAALIPAFITGLSLYIIPSWATDNFELKAKIESKSGKKKTYTLNDTTKIVQWLPMAFLYSSNNMSVIPEVRKNMYRNLLSKMERDGFFHIEPNQQLSSVNNSH